MRPRSPTTAGGVAHGGGARRPGHRRTPHDGGRGHHAGRGRRPRAGREGRDRPLRLRPADGRLPGTDAARLRGPHRLRVGRLVPPRAGRRRSDRNVPPLLPLARVRRTVQPPDLGPRRQRPPQGRSDLQGFRARPAHGRGTHRHSDTTYPAAKAYYDSDHGLRYGQPAFGGQCPAAHRRRIYGHVRRRGAAAGGQGAPPGRGRSLVGNGQTPRTGTGCAHPHPDATRTGHLHRHAADVPGQRGGRHPLPGHLPRTSCG